ncbi:TPA: hypothetical protein ACGR4R_000864 [Aeromonas veronii]|uniref:hypothetical protein n=1 Tax=Aeromonas sp. Lyrl_2 TaxID=3110921 RepID=UPI00376B6908
MNAQPTQINLLNHHAAKRLRQRLTAKARHSSCLRGTEGKTLLAQAKRALRWHQLFLSINRRACQ